MVDVEVVVAAVNTTSRKWFSFLLSHFIVHGRREKERKKRREEKREGERKEGQGH